MSRILPLERPWFLLRVTLAHNSIVIYSGLYDFLFGLEVFHEHFSVNVFEVALNVLLVSYEGRYGLARLDTFRAFS